MTELQCRESLSPYCHSTTSARTGRQTLHLIPLASRRVRYLASILCCLGLIGLFATACNRENHVSAASSDDGWHDFQGTWTAAGTRHIMQLGGDRRVSVLMVDGSLVLSGQSRPSVGFR